MERERFRRMRMRLLQAERGHHNNPRFDYRDGTILLVALWAALHNRPIYWACDKRNWPGDLRPKKLPSQSCMSRRLRTWSVLFLLMAWEQVMRDRLPRSDIKFIDGRPLTVGGSTKDPDAGFGYAAGVKAKGYKFHAITDWFGAVDHWLITPMNTSEKVAAEPLIEHMQGAAYLIADNNYDSNRLYDLAGERGTQLLAKPRRGVKGLGHCKHSPYRKQVHAWLTSDASRRPMRHRIRIEQGFGRSGCSDVGLTHPPHHARRTHRVNLWVAFKLLMFHDHLAQNSTRQAA